MVTTYIMDVTKLKEQKFFMEQLAAMPVNRQEKIVKLRNLNDKNRSLGAGMILKKGLQKHGITMEEADIQLGRNGKPYLANASDLQFNLSHAGTYAIGSFSCMDVGVDIEKVQSGKRKVADRFFTPEELMHINQTDVVTEQEEQFFRLWTLKESFLKVTGKGMALAMDSFSIHIKSTITVVENSKTGEYHFTEYVVKSYNNEIYRVAICAKETEFATELVFI